MLNYQRVLRFALSRGCLHPFLHLSLLITPGVLWLRPILEYFCQFMSVLFNRLPGRIFMELHGVFFTTAEVQTFERFQFDRRPTSEELIFSTGHLVGFCIERMEATILLSQLKIQCRLCPSYVFSFFPQ